MKRWIPCELRYGAAILVKMLPRRRGGTATGALSDEPVTVVVAVIRGSFGGPARARARCRWTPGEDAGRVRWRSHCPDRGRCQAPPALVRLRGGSLKGPLVPDPRIDHGVDDVDDEADDH